MIENPQLKPYQLKPQNLYYVEIINVSDKPTYDRSLERSCGGDQILIIKMVEHLQLKPYHLKPQTFEHVEIINVSHKPT